jgi:hypothetical protein
MDLVSFAIAVIVVLIIYLIVKAVLGILKIGVNDTLLGLCALLLLLLVLLGKVSLGV